jgi:hypothetical protein
VNRLQQIVILYDQGSGKRMKIYNQLIKLYFSATTLLLVVGMVSGCAGYSITGGPGKTVNPALITGPVDRPALLKVSSILVLPVEFDSSARAGAGPDLPLYQEVSDALREEGGVEVLADRKLFAGSAEVLTTAKALDIARRSRTDGVLVTQLHDYVERLGSNVAADRPAAVNFTMSVLSAADGRKVWEANYVFRDRALTDNLFRIGTTSKAGWRTASELLNSGLREAVRDFNRNRASVFSGSR